MKQLFLFRLAILNTFKKKPRILLALGGTALMSSIIVVLFGVQFGLRNVMDGEITNGQSTDVVTVTQRNVKKIKLDQTQISEISSISNVSEVAESVGLYGNVLYHGTSLNTAVYAVTDNYFSMSPTSPVHGSLENEPSQNTIILSTQALRVLSIDENDAIGKTLSLSVTITQDYSSQLDDQTSSNVITDTYTIQSVIERGSTPVIYMPIEPLRQKGLDSVAQLSIRLTNPDNMTAVREAVEQRGLQTSSVQDTIDQINKLFEVIHNILIIFSVIMFAVTVSATFTVISLTLMEETRQIGFLRIMGLSHKDVKTLFYIQSVLIASLGAILGTILGYIVGFSLNGYSQSVVNAAAFTQTVNIFAIPILPTIIILVLSVLIGWLVGIIPAKRAVLINPLEELLQ